MVLFKDSSQYNNWMFPKQKLVALQTETHTQAITSITSVVKEFSPSELDKIVPLTISEDQTVQLYNVDMILRFCDRFKFSQHVQATAVAFFKRFFLLHSVMEYDMTHIMLTCIFLACKSEENHISLDKFLASVTEMTSQVIAKQVIVDAEVVLIDGIKYQLFVFHPFRSLDVLMHEIQPQLPATATTLQDLYDQAKSVAKLLLKTDAMFLYPPGTLALGIMYTAFAKKQMGNIVEQFAQEKYATIPKETLHELATTVEKMESNAEQAAIPNVLKKLKPLRKIYTTANNEREKKQKLEEMQHAEAKRAKKLQELEKRDAEEEEALLRGSATKSDAPNIFDGMEED